MKPRLWLLSSILSLGVAALLLFLAAEDGTRAAPAATFTPTYAVAVADTTPETPSDVTVDFGVPEGDVNFAAVVAFIPPEWGVRHGEDIPIGTIIGSLTSQSTLGILNAACNTVLPTEFTFLNGSLDINDTVDFLDSDESGRGDVFEDTDGNGLIDAVDRYPSFINRVLVDPESGEPLQPIRRSIATTVVAGVDVLLQFVLFEPGTVINPALPSDPELGYPSVTLLQNIGDPEVEPAPNPITDFCSPLTSNTITLGVSQDNPDTPDDESGLDLFVNPQDSTYTWSVVALGLRDADGDGIENSLDTCPFDANEGDPRVQGDGDADEDGLDAACDPDDNTAGSDEDLDGYLNRGDNCPLVANGQEGSNQADADSDQIGDDCDPNPEDPDTEGELAFANPTQEVAIGTGEGEPGPPAGFEADGDGDGGLGTGAIIGIIIGAIAAVIIIGGGAFLVMRRGSPA